MLLTQMRKRLDGIAWLGKMKLYVGNLQLVVVRDGSLHHVKPVKLMKQSFAWLHRILRRYNEPHLGEIGVLGHDIGQDKMPHVNGIKRAEEETGFHVLND